MKNCGLFLNMENCVFGFLFFWGFILIVVCFCVSTIKVLKMLVFPSFFGFFLGWLLLLYLGLEGLYVLVFFVFGLLFGVGLVFSLALFCFVLGCCCFCLCFFGLFFFVLFFVFFGGFKGQVRWPEGPPHLALNPPYLFCFFCYLVVVFFVFCFFVFCFLFLFLFFWRV